MVLTLESLMQKTTSQLKLSLAREVILTMPDKIYFFAREDILTLPEKYIFSEIAVVLMTLTYYTSLTFIDFTSQIIF